MSGNLANDNYYQPGALLTDDSYCADVLLGGNPASAWTPGFVELFDSGVNYTFHITYTPPVDAVADLFMRVMWQHSVASASVAFGLFEGANQKAQWGISGNLANNWYSAYLFDLNIALTCGTAYTFYGKYWNGTVGNLTWLEGLIYTRLFLRVTVHP